jgi:NADH-quinone oxidoreductase chain G
MYIYINNKKYDTSIGLTLLQVCNKIGKEIPRFCYHEKLTIAGNCRMCLVEISRPRGPVKPKPAASCAITTAEGIFIHTNTVLVKKARESVLEFLLINHPLDCPICDQGGECDLQDQTLIFGSDRGRFYDLKRTVSDKECGPLIKTAMTRCIHCTRCVRFGNEIAGVDFLGTTGRGSSTEIAPYINDFVYSEISSNIIDLCPVGALTSKPYAYKARPWELRIIETIDVLDSLCSNIRIDVRGLNIMRILPRLNEDINEEWITDRTRFCYDGLMKQRIQKPFFKLGKNFINVSWKNVFLWIGKTLIELKQKKANIIAISSTITEIESIVVLKDLINKLGSSFFWMEQNYALNLDIPANYSFFKSVKELEIADFCILLNFNPRLEMPLLNVRIKKAIKNKNIFVVLYGYAMNLTYKFYNISNNISDFLFFIEGKSYICRKFLKINNPFILQGDSFIYRNDNNNIFSLKSFFDCIFFKIKQKYKNNLIYNFIVTTSSFVNSSEIGFYNKILTKNLIEKNKNYFFYLLGILDKRFLSLISRNKTNCFIIYQGHTGNDYSLASDIILPGSNFTEQNCSFLNLERRIQHTTFIKAPPYLARSDWSILIALSFFIEKPLKYNKIKELNKRIFELSPIIKNRKNKKQNHISIFFKNRKQLNLYYFYNYTILSPFFNYYNSDIITNSSQILALVSKKFVKNKNYYTIEI